MKAWMKGGLIGGIIAFLVERIWSIVTFKDFCAFTGPGGPVISHGLDCLTGILFRLIIVLIIVGIPVAVFIALSKLFKKYWLKGGIFALILSIIISLFLHLETIFHFIGFYLLAFGLGAFIGWLIGRKK